MRVGVTHPNLTACLLFEGGKPKEDRSHGGHIKQKWQGWSKPFWDPILNSPPIFAYFSGDWDVHSGYGVLTHGQMYLVFAEAFDSIDFLGPSSNLETGSQPPIPGCLMLRGWVFH